jgi:REP element-mobilizing transposase RayT
MAVLLGMSYYERNLPHWQPEGRAIFLTWRLRGSLPAGFVRGLQKLSGEHGKQFLAVDQRLDAAATGPRWLRRPEIASCVEAAIRRGVVLGRFVLHAYVVMPNHVHVLLDPLAPVRGITAGIKGASARDGNRVLRRVGKPFWQDESFDHWVRSSAQFERIRAYIEHNPVKAGLAASPEEWQWSSAYK